MPTSEESKQGMTPKERCVQTLTFGHPDRIFYDFSNPRKSTMEAWYRQGLPRMSAVGDYGCPPELLEFVGMDEGLRLPIRTNAFPPFDVRIIEENEQEPGWTKKGLWFTMLARA